MKFFNAVLSFVLIQLCVQQTVSINDACSYRYDLREAQYKWHQKHQTCEDVRKIHPQCREEIEIAYSDQPPYSQNNGNTTQVHGIVAGRWDTRLFFPNLLCCKNIE